MASAKPKKKNPRLASGRKRVRQDTKLNAANTSLRSKYRTAVKNVEKAVLAGDKADDPTLAKTNIADREFVIANGTAAQADEEFNPIKGKEVKVPGKVVSITDTTLTIAVSDDAKQANPLVADFSVTLKEAPKTPPAVGSDVNVIGTIDSYTQKPVMITMTGGEIEAKAAAKPAAPAHHAAPARRR